MISLIEKGKITDLQDNILTSSQQSVQNWTPAGTGSVDLSYADGVNHFEFSNYSTSGAKARFIEEYRQIYNVTMSDAWADYFLTIWKNKGVLGVWENCPYLYTYSEIGSYKNFMQVNSNNRLNSSGVLQVNYGDRVNSTYSEQITQNSVSSYYSPSSETFTMPNGGGNINHYWGSYEDWLSSITKNYTLSFNVDALTPIDTERMIDVLNTTSPFTSSGYTLEKNTSNINNVNDLLTIWKAHTDFKLLVITYNNGAFMSLDLFTGNITISSNRVHYDKFRYEKMLNGSWSTLDYVAKGTDFSRSGSAVTTNEFGLFSSFEATYALPKNIPYLLNLSTRSTTGFTKDASKHDITLTNGNNTYTLEVNPTASQEYQQQTILFTPTSASCNLKLDLSGMQGSGIEIDVKDIGVYEIGGEK